jgi:hypothetical protein
MSELINTKKQENFRRNLLANVSMLALLGYLGVSQGVALAADDDAPILWIELGGQFERADDANEIFAPPFITGEKIPAVDIKPMIAAQAPAPFSIGGEGNITFTPRDTNWVLSVSVNYGRADSARHLHQQTAPPYVDGYKGTQKIEQHGQQFGDGQTDFKESHAVLDFRAGKDVGLGMFGAGGTSVISGGVRFAQFSSSANAALNGQQYKINAVHSGLFRFYNGKPFVPYVYYRTDNYSQHHYGATLNARRNAHAVGPSLSWNASAPIARNSSDMVLALDWGIAGAILFGRQRTKIQHQVSGSYKEEIGRFGYRTRRYYHSNYTRPPVDLVRSRTVTIPNIGGFAGASYRIADFKVSLGYKADFFFGAMDGGIDAAKKENVGFYGPFASISIGLGG